MKEVRVKTRVTEGFPDHISGKILFAHEHTLLPYQVLASSPLGNLQPGVTN